MSLAVTGVESFRLLTIDTGSYFVLYVVVCVLWLVDRAARGQDGGHGGGPRRRLGKRRRRDTDNVTEKETE